MRWVITLKGLEFLFISALTIRGEEVLAEISASCDDTCFIAIKMRGK